MPGRGGCTRLLRDVQEHYYVQERDAARVRDDVRERYEMYVTLQEREKIRNGILRMATMRCTRWMVFRTAHFPNKPITTSPLIDVTPPSAHPSST